MTAEPAVALGLDDLQAAAPQAGQGLYAGVYLGLRVDGHERAASWCGAHPFRHSESRTARSRREG
jgi:hypothetical protein